MPANITSHERVPDITPHLPQASFIMQGPGPTLPSTMPYIIPTMPNSVHTAFRTRPHQSSSTFSQPQMPGAVLQPSIPGYYVGHSQTLPYYQNGAGLRHVNGHTHYPNRPQNDPYLNGRTQTVCNTTDLNQTYDRTGVDYSPVGNSLSAMQETLMVEPSKLETISNNQTNSGADSNLSWTQNVPGIFPWSQPMTAAVQFDGISTQSLNGCNRIAKPKQTRKRRSDTFSDEENDYTSKLHVTEEKMAARMEGLTLQPQIITEHQNVSREQFNTGLTPWQTFVERNNDFLHRDGPGDWSYVSRRGFETMEEIDNRLQVEDSDDEEDGNNNTDQPVSHQQNTLVIAPEVRQQIRTAQEILPKSIVRKLTQSCMQVVLWRPPGHQITQFIEHHLDNQTTVSSPSTDPASSLIRDSSMLVEKEDNEPPEKPSVCDISNIDDDDDDMDL